MRKIAYITDIHLDEKFPAEHGIDARKHWNFILADVAQRGIDEIIFGGDIGEREANEWFFATLKDFKLSVTLGNHDFFDEVTKHFRQAAPYAATELYYASEDDEFKSIFLDSSAASISESQFKWLERELFTDKKLLVFIHHPVLGVDTAVDREFPLLGREKLQNVLHQCGQEVRIFCGHYHMPDERVLGNLRQYISPAASFQLNKDSDKLEVDNSTFGYSIITIQNGGINMVNLAHHDGLFKDLKRQAENLGM